MILYDHRERRSGVPDLLAQAGFELEARDLGSADYVLSPRLAVVRKREHDLEPWLAMGRFHRALADVCDSYDVVVLVLQRSGRLPPGEALRSVLSRVARAGVALLPASGPDEVAEWVGRMARQELRDPEDGWRVAAGRKSPDPDRLVEQLVAWLPGVSFVGARRLLEHFGSLRELALAEPGDIADVPGFGAKRAAMVAEIMAHEYRSAGFVGFAR